MTVTDSGGTKIHVYTYDNIMSWRAKRGNPYTAAGRTSYQYDDSGNLTGDGTCEYYYDPQNRLVRVHRSRSVPPHTLSQALDCRASLAMTCSALVFTTGGAANWTATGGESHQGQWSARSGSITYPQDSYLETQVQGEGTVTFWWKVSSAEGYGYLEFRLDGVLQSGRISGDVDWTEASYPVSGSGTHTLK
jgi:hypothetical protein